MRQLRAYLQNRVAQSTSFDSDIRYSNAAGLVNIIVTTVKELGIRIRILIYGVRDRSGLSSGNAWYK